MSLIKVGDYIRYKQSQFRDYHGVYRVTAKFVGGLQKLPVCRVEGLNPSGTSFYEKNCELLSETEIIAARLMGEI